MDDKLLEDFYKVRSFCPQEIETIGKITEKEKFVAAKQILLGLSVLYVITIVSYLLRPTEGNKLLEICNTTFPALATLVLACYFRDKAN
jgi:hypothetical protein